MKLLYLPLFRQNIKDIIPIFEKIFKQINVLCVELLLMLDQNRHILFS